jgi:25S rRNA (adenine2142-N1)-methyltransferase
MPMDLRSRHPSIAEQDFLLMDQDEHKDKWDVISLSLVLNFVPEPKDRGELRPVVQEIQKLIKDLIGRMLSIAHNMLSPKGLLFLAVSSPH